MKSAARPLLLAALAVGAYLLVTATIRPHVPLPEGYFGLRAKFEAFAAHRDEYDAVYIGSSRSYRAFRPDVIDPLLSRPGRPFRSYNLSMAGMGDFEADALLGRVLALEPARLSWIVIEVPGWRPRAGMQQLQHLTGRMVSWHTPRQTGLALLSVYRMSAGSMSNGLSWEPLRIAGIHLGHLARWQANLGLGPRLWGALVKGPSEALRVARRTFLEQGGYQALEEGYADQMTLGRPRPFLKRRQRFLEDLDRYQAEVMRQAKRSSPSRSDPDPSYNFLALESQKRRIAEAGARVVYAVLPVLTWDPLPQQLALGGHLPAVIDLSQPDLHPELFEVESRFDWEHLSERGARIFSRRFAEEFFLLRKAAEPADTGERR
jgi:hypothetical protein